MNCLGTYCFTMTTYIHKVNYESLSNRCNGIDSLAMLSDGFNFKITSDSFILRW